MNYNFIEIGTSNFRTLIESADDKTAGISIEPIKYYLDQLPNKPNLVKLNVAISTDNNFGEGSIYYIPENIIKERKLKKWLRGCNCMDKYHIRHRGLENLVRKEFIKKIPLYHVFDQYNVETLECLKIDTEGSDSDILLSFLPYLQKKSKENYPKEIIFETNHLTQKNKVGDVIRQYSILGYKVKEQTKEDTVLIL